MRPLKIFISSTVKDLFDHRKAVMRQILLMNHLPLAMELFGSRPTDAMEVCTREVEACDIFVGIYAFRYGYAPQFGRPSITEQEYLLARHKGKRCLCYFADESLRPAVSDEEEWKQVQLGTFKRRIDRELVRQTFDSPDDLCKKLAADLYRISSGDPLGCTPQDLINRWLTWEAEQRVRFVSEDLDYPRDLRGSPFIVDSPLLGLWTDYIGTRPWHEQFIGDVKRMANTASEFRQLQRLVERLKAINWNENYRAILLALEEIASEQNRAAVSDFVRQLEIETGVTETIPPWAANLTPDEKRVVRARSLRDRLADLRRAIDVWPFSRCFLVLGSLGAGKTYLVASLLADEQTHPLSEELELVDSVSENSLMSLEVPSDAGTVVRAHFPSGRGRYLILPIESPFRSARSISFGPDSSRHTCC